MTTFEMMSLMLLLANFAIEVYRLFRDYDDENNRRA